MSSPKSENPIKNSVSIDVQTNECELLQPRELQQNARAAHPQGREMESVKTQPSEESGEPLEEKEMLKTSYTSCKRRDTLQTKERERDMNVLEQQLQITQNLAKILSQIQQQQQQSTNGLSQKIIKPEEEQLLIQFNEQICEDNERVEALDLVEEKCPLPTGDSTDCPLYDEHASHEEQHVQDLHTSEPRVATQTPNQSAIALRPEQDADSHFILQSQTNDLIAGVMSDSNGNKASSGIGACSEGSRKPSGIGSDHGSDNSCHSGCEPSCEHGSSGNASGK